MTAPTVNVSISVSEIIGPGAANAKVTFELTAADVDGTIIGKAPRTLTLDASGNGSIDLWPNTEGAQGTQYIVTITGRQGTQLFRGKATVPNADCSLHNIINLPAPGAITTLPAGLVTVEPPTGFTAHDQQTLNSEFATAIAQGGGGAPAWGAITGNLVNQTDLSTALAAKVPTTRTVNGQALSADITLTAANVGAPSGSGTSTGSNTGDQDLSSYATTTAVAAGYQPLDSDLTAIAALSTTAYGRALLALADAAAGRAALALGTLATQSGTFSGTSSGVNTGDQDLSTYALKTYVDSAVTGLWEMKGSQDCSANPNYPAANKGDAYVVSVAGKIGGASGASVDVGDVFVATADNAGGTQASVGASWTIIEHNLAGALLASNNLSDLANAATARGNLGLVAVASSGSASDLSSGTLAAGRMPALTGDVTSSAGAVATTLATVNSNVGSFTNASVTVDAKGRVTAVSSGSGGSPGGSSGQVQYNDGAGAFAGSPATTDSSGNVTVPSGAKLHANAADQAIAIDFGGTTASFPGLRRFGNRLEVALADLSNFAAMGALKFISPGNTSGGFFITASGMTPGVNDVGLARGGNNLAWLLDGTVTNFIDLKLRGVLGTGALSTGTVAKTASYTITLNDYAVEADATSGAVVLTLPALSTCTPGQEFIAQKTDASANAVTFDGNGSETINGATTLSTTTQYATLRIKVNAAKTGFYTF